MPTLTDRAGILTYGRIQSMKREQERLIAEGKMECPAFSYDVFTPEQEEGFRRGVTIDDIFNRYAQ